MNHLRVLALVLLSMTSMSVISNDLNKPSEFFNTFQPSFLKLSKDFDSASKTPNLNYNFSRNTLYSDTNNIDWIKTHINKKENFYSFTTDNNLAYGNEISIAWNFTNFFKINLNVFENQMLEENSTSFNSYNKLFNNYASKSNLNTTPNEINRSISGYKFGISSELGLGNNYKLGLNLDYGQMDGANLVGFNNDEISTTSFAVGIRKSKFGASVNTDIFLEENIDLMQNSRLGFEIDWYFSDETKLSLGSKQGMNNLSSEVNNSLESLTGNVQYIKFQHNL